MLNRPSIGYKTKLSQHQNAADLQGTKKNFQTVLLLLGQTKLESAVINWGSR